MAYENLRLGCDSLTNNVYIGKINKDGKTWASNKKDVTGDFLTCVAARFAGYSQKFTVNGKYYYVECCEISKEEFEEDKKGVK